MYICAYIYVYIYMELKSVYIYGVRKMAVMTLYVRQQKRHRCKEQTFGLCGRRMRVFEEDGREMSRLGCSEHSSIEAML